MAINLLGALNNYVLKPAADTASGFFKSAAQPVVSAINAPKEQAQIPRQNTYNSSVPANMPQQQAQQYLRNLGTTQNNTMGVRAVSPTTNQSSVPTTLPKAQTATPSSYASYSSPSTNSQSYGDFTNATAKTPQELAASNITGTGAGSLDPTLFQNNPQNTPTGQNQPVGSTQAPGQYSSNNPASYGGLLNQVANGASGASQGYLDQIAKANAFNDAYVQSQKNQAASQLGALTPGTLAFGGGREQQIQDAYLKQQNADMSGYQGASTLTGAANTQQGLQQSGLLGAAQLAAPVMQFGQLTDPVTGKVISPGGGNPQLNTAVAQTVQLIKNGASPADAIASSGLSNFGLPGQQAFTAAMQQASGGSYNPTLSSAFAGSSASQASDLRTQAVQIQTGLQSLQNVAQAATGIVSQINSSDSPLKNAPIQQYIKSLGNSDAAAQMSLVMADIKKFTGQILAANAGGIPTDVSNSMASIDPSLLNASQLQHYLQMADYLGNQQKAAIQSQIQGLAGTPYAGYTGGASTGSVPGNNANTSWGSGVTGVPEQIAAGLGVDAGNGVAQAATNGGNILSFILGKIF